MGRWLFVLGLACVSLRAAPVADNRLATYPAPAGAELNDTFDVRVRTPGGEWRELPAYLVRVRAVRDAAATTEPASMASFDFSGEVEVSVTHRSGPIQSARVRPLSLGIRPVVEGDRLAFTIKRPCDLSVEINGDIFHNLHLFARALPGAAPDPRAANVITFGPGLHELPEGRLKLLSGQRVYLAGGAVVRGSLMADGVEDVVISGRGIIEQGGGGKKTGDIWIANSRRVRVEGLILSGVRIGNSHDVTISDVKCISHVRWGDGIDVFSSRGVTIDRAFCRNSDDCLAVYGTRGSFKGSSSEIVLKNSTLWADVAHPILIGTHGNTSKPDVLEDITVSNIDILDQMERQLDYQGCMAINAGDSNLVRNVRFEDVRVEDFRQGQLVNLRVFFNRKYCTSPGRGIENVEFKDVSYTGTRANISIIAGYDDARKVRNVVFTNLVVNGTAITDTMPEKPGYFKAGDMAGIFVGEHVEGLVFRSSSETSDDEASVLRRNGGRFPH